MKPLLHVTVLTNFLTEVSTNHLFPRSIFELWGHGRSPEELYSSLKNYPVEKMVRNEMCFYIICLQIL